MRDIALLMFTVTVSVLGTICLFFPEKIQEWAFWLSDQGLTLKLKALDNYLRSKAYLYNVRFVGIVAFFMFIFILWMLIKTAAQVPQP